MNSYIFLEQRMAEVAKWLSAILKNLGSKSRYSMKIFCDIATPFPLDSPPLLLLHIFKNP